MRKEFGSVLFIPDGTFADYIHEKERNLIRSNTGNLLDNFEFRENTRDGSVELLDISGRKIKASISSNVAEVLEECHPIMFLEDICLGYQHLEMIKKAFDDFHYRPTVMGIVCNDMDEFLVLRSSKGKWHFPQGGIDPVEANWSQNELNISKFENLFTALTRELKEETGIGLESDSFAFFVSDYVQREEYKPGRLARVYELDGRQIAYNFGKQYHVCGVRTDSFTDFHLDPEEVSDIKYVSFAELADLGISDWKIRAAEDLFGR